MPDKLYMLWKPCVREFIGHTEDLTKASNTIGFKHLNVHAFGDAVFDFILADIEIIVGNAAVLHALFVIGYIPLPCNVKAVRKKVDDRDDPLKEVPALFKALVDDLYRVLIGITKGSDLQTHGHNGINVRGVRCRIDVVFSEVFGGVHLPEPGFESLHLLLYVGKPAFFKDSPVILSVCFDRFFCIHLFYIS